jgi:hypothetical protein
VTGAIDGDTVNINNPAAGLYDTKHVGTGKNVSVTGLEIASASNGNAVVYGYQLSATGANGNIGTITKAPLTITAQTNTKTYDGNTSAAATPTYAGLQGGDTLTGLSETYDTADPGTGKTLTVAPGYTLDDGNSGDNYTVTTVADTTGVINKDVNAQQQDQEIVQAENTTVAAITNTDTAMVEQKNAQTAVPAAKEEPTASSDTQSAEGKDKDKDKDKEKDSDKKGAKDERKDEPTKVKLPYCN